MVIQAIDIHTDPSFSGTMDPDMAINNSLGLVVTMTPDGNVGLSDQNGASSSLVLGLQHGPKRQPKPTRSLMVMAFNTDPSCGRTPDSYIVPGHSFGSDVNMTADGSKGHHHLYGPSGSKTLGTNVALEVALDPQHLHCHWFLSEPWT